jgi:hypothetical protein
MILVTRKVSMSKGNAHPKKEIKKKKSVVKPAN